LVLLACPLPSFWLHFRGLWNDRPHYRFFPIVLVVFAWLLWRRWPRGEVTRTRLTRWMAWLLVLTGTLGLAAAVAFDSPASGAAAGIVTLGGVLTYLAGRAALSELAPVWLLLWTTIPLPGQLDGDVVSSLQAAVSRSASALLDWMQVDHLLAGNVFELPRRQLAEVEACGGIHSPLILIALSFVLAATFRRPALHAVLLVVAAVAWSLVVNIARVTTVVAAADWWGTDWSSGWQHQALGCAWSLAGLGLLLSTDGLLWGLLGPVLDPEDAGEGGRPVLASDSLSRLWNRVVARTVPD
jgi:exosortase